MTFLRNNRQSVRTRPESQLRFSTPKHWRSRATRQTLNRRSLPPRSVVPHGRNDSNESGQANCRSVHWKDIEITVRLGEWRVLRLPLPAPALPGGDRIARCEWGKESEFFPVSAHTRCWCEWRHSLR